MQQAYTSPCTGMCSFERRTGFCIGCARTSSEIVGWRAASEEARGAILARLAARQARLGFVQRLPWSPEDIRTFVMATLKTKGAWVTGLHGAIAAFRRGAGEEVALRTTDASVAASTARGAISFSISSKVRAYAVSSSPLAEVPRASAGCMGALVVIAVSRSCGFDRPARGLACLGMDGDAMSEPGRSERLYDFGLGERAGSFGVRTADPDLAQNLDLHLGEVWPRFFPVLAPAIMRTAPARVVRNPLGRIEVYTATWTDETNDGPYAHFHPALLATSETEPAIEMGDSYLPCAVYYP